MILGQVERVTSAVARGTRRQLHRMRAHLAPMSRPVILMYHRIADERFDPWGLVVAPHHFAEQLSWLAEHRTLLSLVEFVALHRRRDLPDDAAAVTFDDAYACTAHTAVPLLERFGVPATIFLPAALIGRDHIFWWDELQQIVLNHQGTSVHAAGRSFDIGERSPGDRVWPANSRRRTPRQIGFYAIWSWLQPQPKEAIKTAMAELRTQQALEPPADAPRLMTVDELRTLRPSVAIDFGSHAMSHVSLRALPPEQKEREILDSIRTCEHLTGKRPTTFAYPFGDFDAESAALVATAGFECACTVERRAVAPGDDPFLLPRIGVGNWNARQLGGELALASLEPKAVTVAA